MSIPSQLSTLNPQRQSPSPGYGQEAEAGNHWGGPERWQNPGGLYPGGSANPVTSWVPQQGKLGRPGSPQQLPGNGSRKPGKAAAAKGANASTTSCRPAAAGRGQPARRQRSRWGDRRETGWQSVCSCRSFARFAPASREWWSPESARWETKRNSSRPVHLGTRNGGSRSYRGRESGARSSLKRSSVRRSSRRRATLSPAARQAEVEQNAWKPLGDRFVAGFSAALCLAGRFPAATPAGQAGSQRAFAFAPCPPGQGIAPPGVTRAALFVLALFTHTNLKHLPRFLRKLLHSDEVAAAVIKTQLITYPLNCNDRILSIC